MKRKRDFVKIGFGGFFCSLMMALGFCEDANANAPAWIDSIEYGNITLNTSPNTQFMAPLVSRISLDNCDLSFLAWDGFWLYTIRIEDIMSVAPLVSIDVVTFSISDLALLSSYMNRSVSPQGRILYNMDISVPSVIAMGDTWSYSLVSPQEHAHNLGNVLVDFSTIPASGSIHSLPAQASSVRSRSWYDSKIALLLVGEALNDHVIILDDNGQILQGPIEIELTEEEMGDSHISWTSIAWLGDTQLAIAGEADPFGEFDLNTFSGGARLVTSFIDLQDGQLSGTRFSTFPIQVNGYVVIVPPSAEDVFYVLYDGNINHEQTKLSLARVRDPTAKAVEASFFEEFDRVPLLGSPGITSSAVDEDGCLHFVYSPVGFAEERLFYSGRLCLSLAEHIAPSSASSELLEISVGGPFSSVASVIPLNDEHKRVLLTWITDPNSVGEATLGWAIVTPTSLPHTMPDP